MLIKDIVENQGSRRNNLRSFARGFGQELARRYVPDIEFAKRSGRPAVTAPQPTVAPVSAQTPVVPATTAPTAPVAPVAPVATAAAPQPAATKPRVSAQPIRVGNKVYRPGDVMHARLSQMMQAQQQT